MTIQYTGAQWSLIDLANMYGHKLDKKPFDIRLNWGRNLLQSIKDCTGISDLHSAFKTMIAEADEPEMFTASLLNVWDITQGRPTGYFIEQDAASSGPQILSAAGRCIRGMMNTGLLGDNVPDLYTTIFDGMKESASMGLELKRSEVKKATVPYVYGSSASPRKVFGDFAKLFTENYFKAVPRAEVIKNLLIGAWDNTATSYTWMMPDGHTVHVKVIRKAGKVFFFNGNRFTYLFKEVGAKEAGEEGTKALAARVTHSLDGYQLREVKARCNHDPVRLQHAVEAIEDALAGGPQMGTSPEMERLSKLSAEFEMVSIRGAELAMRGYLENIPHDYLTKLLSLTKDVLNNKPFTLKLIHDGYGALPNNVNVMKQHYNNGMAEIYEGVWLFKVLHKLTGKDFSNFLEPVDPAISDMIRNNSYAIG